MWTLKHIIWVNFNGQERFDSKFRSAAQSPHPLVGCRTRYRAQPWAPSRRSGALRVSVDTTIKREAQRTLLKPCSATPPSEPACSNCYDPGLQHAHGNPPLDFQVAARYGTYKGLDNGPDHAACRLTHRQRPNLSSLERHSRLHCNHATLRLRI